MIYPEYDEWSALKIDAINSANDLVPCPNCCGWGEVECECCEQEVLCKTCEGDGKVPIYEGYRPPYKEYLTDGINTARKICDWTGTDFLIEAGKFIKISGRGGC